MSVFHFKQFDVTNVRSAMKVNTDGILLGASVDVSFLKSLSQVNVLDVGTGTGTIALMLAQRISTLFQENSNNEQQGLLITGIDIDVDSAEEAAENFLKSPWNGILKSRNVELSQWEQELSASQENTDSDSRKYDLIVSNPPYFESSLKAPEKRRNAARHTDSLSYKELMDFSEKYLKEGGHLAVILPSEVEKSLLRYGRMCSLFPDRIWRIRTTPKKEASRIIVEFIKGKRENVITSEQELILQSEGKYTDEYTRLVHEFYLWA